ncbi:helix-turn-helix domain-containing protein [Caballeronia sp. RCC_10]|uniref:AraC-like ligand-binding domain-containing protein n=1 Tax=Caballeronia sp. RCC_10 TaxID=3239227 RepID=UPI003523D213
MQYSFSTSVVPAPQRFDYWRDVVCSHCIPAGSDSPHRARFDAELTGRSIGVLDVARMTGPEHNWVRDFTDIRRGPEDNLWLSFLERGEGHLEQNGSRVVQRAGDIVLYDASRPFSYTIAPASFFIVRLPRDLLLRRTGSAERLVATSLGPGTGFRALLGAMIKEACESSEVGQSSHAEPRIAAAILDLVAAVVELHEGDSPAPSAQAALYNRALSFIQDNVENPGLDVDCIASLMHVSTRTLARAFAGQGTTPMKAIWQQRLKASYCALRERSVKNVTQAAMTFGFCDVSHFSRSFKKHFGVTPQSVLLDAKTAVRCGVELD